MQWSAARHAGFAPPDAEELWLPVASDYETVNVDAALADPDSLLNLYRRLLAYRKTSAALREGRYESISPAEIPAQCLAYLRQVDDDRLFVALSFSPEPMDVALPAPGEVALSTHSRDRRRVGRSLRLEPNEGVCVELDP